MLSAPSLFLWLPLTKPELGKIPPDFAVGAQCGGGSCYQPQHGSSLSLHQLWISFSIPELPRGVCGAAWGPTQPELPGCACTSTPLYLFIASVFTPESHSLLALLSQTSTKSDKRKVAFPPEGYIIYEAYRSWEITQGRSSMSYIPSYTGAVNYLQAATSFLCPQGSGM